MMTIGFIGAGTVGTALAVRLKEKGYNVAGVTSRSKASSQRLAGMAPGCKVYCTAQKLVNAVDLVFVTTPDDSIRPTVAGLTWRPGKSVVHVCGALSTDVLEPARRAGAGVAAFHPLQTFASIAYAIKNIPGSTFAIEAEEPLAATLKEMAGKLDCSWVTLKPGDKVLYHAAAVIASNYLVTLIKASTELWRTLGVSEPEAINAMMPLIKGTVSNIENVGLPNCLTGPIARGDAGTLRRHLEALEKSAPGQLDLYKKLGMETVPIALAKGRVSGEKASEMETLLSREPVRASRSRVVRDAEEIVRAQA